MQGQIGYDKDALFECQGVADVWAHSGIKLVWEAVTTLNIFDVLSYIFLCGLLGNL